MSWRSSYWFITLVIWLGITTDLLSYSIITPAIPFQLEKFGYSKVSALVGWLLFSYSAGLVMATLPVAMFSERYHTRRLPMILGLFILIGSQVMIMEARHFAIMFLARMLQGIGSSLVWVVGVALLCDATPEHLIGRQSGLAMSGMSVGITIGPPIGGALYTRFGFRGPFIFSFSAAVLDLIGRLLVKEKHDIATSTAECSFGNPDNPGKARSTSVPLPHHDRDGDGQKSLAETDLSSPPSLSSVLCTLAKSSRTLVALALAFALGVLYAGPESSIVLYLQSSWGLQPEKIGLIFLASSIPTFLSSILNGWLTDRFGVEWVTFSTLLLSVPWWTVLMVKKSLALFTVAMGMQFFFASGAIAPLITELASISRVMDRVGFAHIYGVWGIAYGIGSAVGPVIFGQIYAHVNEGWVIICIVSVSILLGCLFLSFLYTGANPFYRRIWNRDK